MWINCVVLFRARANKFKEGVYCERVRAWKKREKKRIPKKECLYVRMYQQHTKITWLIIYNSTREIFLNVHNRMWTHVPHTKWCQISTIDVNYASFFAKIKKYSRQRRFWMHGIDDYWIFTHSFINNFIANELSWPFLPLCVIFFQPHT